MKVKTKLLLGVGALFLMIVLLTGLGAYYINKSRTDTKNILVANYNSLLYSKNMMLALDHSAQPDAGESFQKNLDLEGKNITEAGEKEAYLSLAKNYSDYKNNPSSEKAAQIRKDLGEVMRLNMEAIQRKSDIANATAENAAFWILALGTVCFLISTTLLFNIPNSIAEPISRLTASIREIANRNYHERVWLPEGGEFAELAQSFNTMAGKLEEYESSNLAHHVINKKRVETLIENMHDPVIGLDEAGTIVFINEEALNITGLVKTDAMGKNVAELAVHNVLLREILQREAKPEAESLKIFADEKESYFDQEVIPIRIAQPGQQGAKDAGKVLLLRNITHYKELELAKTNFIATISHELKTPLASIKMGTQLLQSDKVGPLNDAQHELIHSIEEDSNRILNITGELLKLSQVQSGDISLEITNCTANQVITPAAEAVDAARLAKNIKLSRDEAQESSVALLGDREKLVWIVKNLLSNAVRHSPENSEIILRSETTGNRSRISVRDFGSGIEPRLQSRIFEAYFKAPEAAEDSTGLGLAICKNLVEKMGGSIHVSSVPGEGSTFWIDIPE